MNATEEELDLLAHQFANDWRDCKRDTPLGYSWIDAMLKLGWTKKDEAWEYGFYDSEDDERTIYWYVFGLKHATPESAKRTGGKSTWGTPVIVRRREGDTAWEHYTEATP